MAVLNNIRKHGIFLIIIIAMALFAFVLADVIRNGGFSSGKSQSTIAVINGQDISRVEFSNRLDVTRRNARGRLSNLQAVNLVWNSVLQQTLVNQQIEALGLDVGEKQIANALAQRFSNQPQFLTNGQFNINKFRAYLERLKAVNPAQYRQWVIQEQNIIAQAKANTYFDLIAAGVGMTSADAKAAYKLNNTSFDIKYVRIPYTAVDSSKIEVTDGEIQEYISQHKEQFKSEGSRDIRYVLFPQQASPADAKALKTELAKLLEDQEVFNEAAGINQTIKGFKNTKDYDIYLSEFSDIPFRDVYFYKSDLSEEYADQLFNLPEGKIFGPYKDNGYWKYTKVIDRRQMPDSVKIKQILISYKGLRTGQGLERTEAEAEQLADSLLNVVQSNPEKFGELAQAYSDNPRTKAKGGDMGWITHPKGASNDLIKFAFTNKPGSSKVINTQFGYLLLYIDAAKNMQEAVKLATLARKIEPSNETLNTLFNKATKFQIAAKNGDFAQKAKKEGYDVRTVKNLQPLDGAITGLGLQRNIVKWAFNKKTQPGNIKRFNTDAGYVVAQLTASTSKGLLSAEEAAARVKPILMKKEVAEYLKKQISGNDLSTIASKYGTQVKSKNNMSYAKSAEPKIVGKAFALEKGQVSEPIAANSGVYIIKLIQKQTPPKKESYKEFIQKASGKNKQMAVQNALKALKDKAEIVDRRAEFY